MPGFRQAGFCGEFCVQVAKGRRGIDGDGMGRAGKVVLLHWRGKRLFFTCCIMIHPVSGADFLSKRVNFEIPAYIYTFSPERSSSPAEKSLQIPHDFAEGRWERKSMNKYAVSAGKSCILIHHYYVNVQIKTRNQKFTRFGKKARTQPKNPLRRRGPDACFTSAKARRCEGRNAAAKESAPLIFRWSLRPLS